MMTKLMKYYQEMEDGKRYPFMLEIALECGLTVESVRKLFYGYNKTKKDIVKKVLSEKTGIPDGELFDLV